MKRGYAIVGAAAALLAGCAASDRVERAAQAAQEQIRQGGASAPRVGSLVDRAPVRALTPEQNQARSIAFLAQNLTQPGVAATASGLQYSVVRAVGADLPRPTAADRVRVHYEGRLVDGQVFDSSIARGEPAEFPLSGVIPAWTEGVQLMKPGEEFLLFAPSELAYGARGAGNGSIPPYSALVFRVQLLGFTRPDGTQVDAQGM